MTCFWDALRSKLNISTDNKTFIIHLKNNNKKDIDVMWNDTSLSDKQRDENFEHIQNFNENAISDGYDCSTCDPFLLLICELYNISICHTYLGNALKYYKNNSPGVIHFASDRGHFW